MQQLSISWIHPFVGALKALTLVTVRVNRLLIPEWPLFHNPLKGDVIPVACMPFQPHFSFHPTSQECAETQPVTRERQPL